MLTNNKTGLILATTLFLTLGIQSPVLAHFGMIIPATDMVAKSFESKLDIKVMFGHPFEGSLMKMEKPVQFGVMVDGEKEDLLSTLKVQSMKMYSDTEYSQTWQTRYQIQRPGDYLFYMEPQPYWEPAEDCYIIHYTKVIVDAFGKEDGWDQEIGLKTEIIPLTRPFGLYAGNVFQGIVKVNGKPAPFSEVEIEYYNEKGEFIAPKGPFVTQVVKCDQNGVFTYAIPHEGWWGFAALNEDEKTISFEGEEKPVEIGAVLWVQSYAMTKKPKHECPCKNKGK